MRLDVLRCSALFLATASSLPCSIPVSAQKTGYDTGYAYPLTVDRGASGVWQSLEQLHTRASLLMVTAHPDDEDGGMLAYESRHVGAETSLLTLNRGEGGQNVMSADYWDQLGVVRTQELLRAGDAYGVHQYWTRVADFGFSKTIEEALKTWGHDRVLYDAVRVVRMTRPLVVTSVFAGNVSDGHGQHQVAGSIAQEVYKVAGDPNVFPDQIRAGLQPWSPMKVYARVPFARVTEKGIYDYATGHWGPVRFRNYVDGTWIQGTPTTTLEVPVGTYDPLFGRSYLAVAREGLAEQKSQNGGVGIPLEKQVLAPYHLYASRIGGELPSGESSFFDGIDTSLPGIALYAPKSEQSSWSERLKVLNSVVEKAMGTFDARDPGKIAPDLAQGLTLVRTLRRDIAESHLASDVKFNMDHELAIKERQFNAALSQALGVSLLAVVTDSKAGGRSGLMGDMAGQQSTFQTVIPGEKFSVGLHFADQGSQPVTIVEAHLISSAGSDWNFSGNAEAKAELKSGEALDRTVAVTVPESAEPTKAYYSRLDLAQSYYDIQDESFLNLPGSPYPLSAIVHYQYQGVEASYSAVVQTVHRITGPGPQLEPLLVAPAISVTVSPTAGIVGLDSKKITLKVTVRSSVKGAAGGSLHLELPSGWTSEPQTADFEMSRDGEQQTIDFSITPKSIEAKSYTITAVGEYAGKQFRQGFQTVGYTGLRPYPYYRMASYRTTGVDVKLAPGLKVAYVMGPGDDVAQSLENIGVHASFLSAQDIAHGDLSSYDAIILGIRTYAIRPELATYNKRLLEYVRAGGTVIVQYQTPEYDHNFGPYPLSLSADPEKVVEEDCAVSLLSPNDPVLSWPNRITVRDFDNWVEERGHGFLRSWDPHYVALTEMHDAEQDPQKGGLIYASYGKGHYVYLAYAFFRQMPEGVPGAYRIMANLLSLSKNPLKR